MQVVHLRVNDSTTGKPTPVRLRLSTPDGRYLPPLGRPAKFPTGWGQHVGGSVLLDGKEHCYIDGACEVLLPDGPIHVEISKGPEYAPIQQVVERKPGQLALRFTIERKFNMNAEGWYSGDTHVRSMSPRAAWLEGAGEGLNVVNLLAAEWIERDGNSRIDNILDFSGQEPAVEKDGCMVVVNTLNRSNKLGDLTLLNCHRVVHPLRLEQDGFEQYTHVDWCKQCHRKGGLVIAPLSPTEGGTLSCVLLGLIDAMEWTPFGFDPSSGASHKWQAFLNWGFHIPIVGGSRVPEDSETLGGVRTYVQLPAGERVTYGSWINGIREGRTFATRGPLLKLTVNGKGPGTVLDQSELETPLRIRVEAHRMSLNLAVIVFLNGSSIQPWDVPQGEDVCFEFEHRVSEPGYILAQCHDGYNDPNVHASTSPIYLQPPGKPTKPKRMLAEELRRRKIWVSKTLDDAGIVGERRKRLDAIAENVANAMEARLQ